MILKSYLQVDCFAPFWFHCSPEFDIHFLVWHTFVNREKCLDCFVRHIRGKSTDNRKLRKVDKKLFLLQFITDHYSRLGHR